MLLPKTRAADVYQDDHELVEACLSGRHDAWISKSLHVMNLTATDAGA